MRRTVAAAAVFVLGLVAAGAVVAPAEAADGVSVDLAVLDGNYNELQSSDRVSAGDILQFAVSVTNNSSSDVSNVKAVLWLPTQVTFDSSLNDPAASYSASAHTVTWLGGTQLGTIAAGDDPHTVSAFVTVKSAATFDELSAYAKVAVGDVAMTDPSTSCPSSTCVAVNPPTATPTPSTSASDTPSPSVTPSATETPSASPSVSDTPSASPSTETSSSSPSATPSDAAKLAVTVQAPSGQLGAGSTATFTVTVRNTGVQDLDDVRLALRLSDGLTFTSATPEAEPTSETGTVHIRLGAVAAGSTTPATVTATVDDRVTSGSTLGLTSAAADGEWWLPTVCDGVSTACADTTVATAATPSASTTSASATPSSSSTTIAVDTGQPGGMSRNLIAAGILLIAAAASVTTLTVRLPRRSR